MTDTALAAKTALGKLWASMPAKSHLHAGQWHDDVYAALTRLSKLEPLIAELTGTLRFYADPDNYVDDPTEPLGFSNNLIQHDGGTIAKTALDQLKEVKP